MTVEVVVDKLVLRLAGVGSVDPATIARLVAEGLAAVEPWPNRASVDRVLVEPNPSTGHSVDELAAQIVSAVFSELERVG